MITICNCIFGTIILYYLVYRENCLFRCSTKRFLTYLNSKLPFRYDKVIVEHGGCTCQMSKDSDSLIVMFTLVR